MNFSDVLAFAKAGWTPADVKEMMKATTEEQPKDEGSLDAQENVSRETLVDSEQPKEEIQKEQEDIDYKALYEAEQKKVKELQNANIKRDIKGEQDNKTDDDIVADFVRSFM